jgi:hypothetical protein
MLLIIILIAWIVAETVFGIRIPGVIIIAVIAAVSLGTAFLLFPPAMWWTLMLQSMDKKG